MSKPYDATLKALLTASPRDWPRLAGFPATSVKIIDADLSTITAATDKVLRLKGPPPSLMHFEFQAGPDADLPHRVLVYNSLLGQAHHHLPVYSVIVLLRPEAFLRTITGTYEQHYPGVEEPNLVFRYRVVRVWEIPAATLLKGGIGTLALAPIGAVPETELPALIREMQERLDQRKYEKIAGELWTAVRVLMGLRYEEPFIDQLLRGVHRMKESVTYQTILNEGVAKGLAMGVAQGVAQEARRILIKLGEKAFHQPANPETLAALEAIQDPEKLEELAVNLLQAKSWEELVPIVPKPSRRRKKKS